MGNYIETERLLIRRFREDDWRELYAYLGDEEVVFYEPYDSFTEEQCKKEAIIRKDEECFWAVTLKECGSLIGNLYIEKHDFGTYEIGYVFNKSFHKKGYATEGARALMKHAYNQLGARRIIARCNPENISSWKLLERLGLRREGHLKENIYFRVDDNGKPIWQDTYMYGQLEYENN